MDTPEKPSLECFSSIRSSSNLNLSEIVFFQDSSETQKSREEGFSCSILMNLAEDNSKPASRLINITQTRPGQIPRKLLLPLFYQESLEEFSFPIRTRRSQSVDSKNSSVTAQPVTEQKKIVTTTTVNTQSNTDIVEIHAEFLKEKNKFEYEQGVREAEVGKNEFGVLPCVFNCQFCGFRGESVVERRRDGSWVRSVRKVICCCLGREWEGRYEHVCPGCKEVVFSFIG